MVEGRKKKEESQKIDDLSLLVANRSVSLAMLSSEFNGLNAH